MHTSAELAGRRAIAMLAKPPGAIACASPEGLGVLQRSKAS